MWQVPVNVFDTSQRATPLFCAAAIENSACLPLLLSSGADVNYGLHGLSVSALLAAVREEHALALIKCYQLPITKSSIFTILQP